MSITHRNSFPVNQRGFGLIEVMVSFLILAIGLIGIGGMVSAGLQNNSDAMNRSQAVILAQDMADRVRVNRGTDYVTTMGGDTDALDGNECVAGDLSTLCSAANLAVGDVVSWQTEMQQRLPSGAGLVCVDSTPFDGSSPTETGCDGSGGVLAIKIWWIDASIEDADGASAWQRIVISAI